LSVIGLKKNLFNTGCRIPDFSDDAKIAYDNISKGLGSETGREILVARGLMEWLTCFHKAVFTEEKQRPRILVGSTYAGSTEDIVILFANILLEATI